MISYFDDLDGHEDFQGFNNSNLNNTLTLKRSQLSNIHNNEVVTEIKVGSDIVLQDESHDIVHKASDESKIDIQPRVEHKVIAPFIEQTSNSEILKPEPTRRTTTSRKGTTKLISNLLRRINGKIRRR